MLHFLLRDQPSLVFLVNFIMTLFHVFLREGGGGRKNMGAEYKKINSSSWPTYSTLIAK